MGPVGEVVADAAVLEVVDSAAAGSVTEAGAAALGRCWHRVRRARGRSQVAFTHARLAGALRVTRREAVDVSGPVRRFFLARARAGEKKKLTKLGCFLRPKAQCTFFSSGGRRLPVDCEKP